jgi:hypothetical protein
MLIALMEAPIALQKCGLEARTQAYGWWNQGKERRKKSPDYIHRLSCRREKCIVLY